MGSMALAMAAAGSVSSMQTFRPSMGGGAAQDTLRRLLMELCIKVPTPKEDGVLTLREHVEEEARDLSGEAFTRFMDNLYERIMALVESPNPADNVGAIHAIDELIDVSLGENAAKISRFASHLRHIFEEKVDPDTMIAASAALGHLARAGGALTADVVEFQVRQALEWLGGERVEARKFAAVLILKEMAENAPTVFNVHVQEFIDAIWAALRDPKLAVRERAVEALRACLCVIEKRETRWRVQGYYRLFEETQKGLVRSASVESIHGSLLAIGELLRNTGEFMMARYKEVTNIVLKYRDHRERLVRRSITALLPRIAHFLRDRFVASYLQICMEHLLGVMRNPVDRDTGFAALGEMAGAVGGALVPYLPALTALLKEAIGPRRGRPSMEALACLGQLAAAVGPVMTDHVRNLLDVCFASGLSLTLVTTLSQIATRLPVLLPVIQERLLETISAVLAKKQHKAALGSVSLSRPPLGAPTSPAGGSMPSVAVELSAPALTQLALRTLCTFDLSGHELLEFAKEHVGRYLEDDDVGTRREAAICCCRLLEYSCSSAGGSPRSAQAGRGRRRRALVEEKLERLLVTCVADPDAGVRRAVLGSFGGDGGLDAFLAQADSLRALFIALNDESYEVRELAIVVSGRLANRNPAYVLPALRRHLLQLLGDLEHSTDSKQKEESARLLGCLIRGCTRLIVPYIPPVLRVLIGKLREGTTGAAGTAGAPGGGGTMGVVGSVLATVGELAKVGGGALRSYLGELLPLIVDALHDGAAGGKKEIAVATLGQVVESTGYVVTPYTEYPQLLGLLLRLLNGELAWSMRRTVLQVLGILGALDPHTHKRNQLALSLQPANVASTGPSDGGGGGGGGHIAHVHARSVDDPSTELLPPGGLSTTSDDYYSTVAITALMRILRDGALASYHQRVVGSVMYIFKAMGLACVPYLPKVMPELFHVMRTCEDGLREFLFWQLAQLVAIVRQHMRKYLNELLSLIFDYWNALMLPVLPRPPAASPVLNLVEQLCRALNDEFRAHMPEILPRCVAILSEAERTGDYTKVPPVLHTFEVFGASMEDHMHLLLPALVRLFKPGLSDAPLEIQRAALRTLARLLPAMQVAGHAAAIVHPLMRVLDGPIDELRREAADAICALAVAQGADFLIFVPSIRKLMQRHRMQHAKFDNVAARVMRREPALLMDVLPAGSHSTVGAASPWGGGAPHGSSGSMNGFSVEGESERMEGEATEVVAGRQLKVNERSLKKAWESSQRSTKEDWAEWMRHFSVQLLKESPSPALRTCAGLAQLQPHVARELFAAGFVSCWAELNETAQEQLVRSLEAAFASPNIPPEILATLLNLAEFMEHDEKPLPVDIRTLGALAEKCHAYAKALHYKEMEFEQSPTTTVEALIHVNNQLQQHEAAVGILVYAQQHLAVELKESWYEKLQRWDEALAAYERKAGAALSPHAMLDATLGRMRCLGALAHWEELSALCKEAWAPAEPSARLEMAPLGAQAAWNMGKWDEMAEYVSVLDDGGDSPGGTGGRMVLHASAPQAGGGLGVGSSDGAFFRAVLCVRRGQHSEARMYVDRARKLLATELAALVLESYERAYGDVVRVQQLAELEEVIEYSQLPVSEPRAALIQQMWQDRIRGTQRNVEVWQALLAVRSLVLPMAEDVPTWLKFSSLCRKSGRISQSHSTLLRLLQYDPEQAGHSLDMGSSGGGGGGGGGGGIGRVAAMAMGQVGVGAAMNGVAVGIAQGSSHMGASTMGSLRTNAVPQVMLAYLKHMWSLGGETTRRQAYRHLQDLASEMAQQGEGGTALSMGGAAALLSGGAVGAGSGGRRLGQGGIGSANLGQLGTSVSLAARVFLKLGSWAWALQPALSEPAVGEITASLRAATEEARGWGKAWHVWALFNTAAMSYYTVRGNPQGAQRHVVAAVSGYFRSIALSPPGRDNGDDSVQDILRLLTLWFSHGNGAEVQAALQEGFAVVNIDTWLLVIPQIIARIHASVPAVRGLIQSLLIRIGRHHPQALMFPLLVACKSMSNARRTAAQSVLDNVRAHSAVLVDEAQLVSVELIRVAILWHEMWHEALEEASRLYFGERNVEGMLAVLAPLHSMLEKQGAETLKEIAFVQAYGHELQEANECCMNYRRTGKEAELTQAWDLYYHVFKRINKQLPSLTTLELHYVSPALVEAKNLELAMPGTYRAGSPVVTIGGFAQQIQVITSKQRPRKIVIYGSDGAEYVFLLKGHEDLRLDERVMQLFGLVNTLLTNARSAAEKDLSIERYAVIPLSPNSGLIGWLPHCDTLHQLIREYRDARKTAVNAEHRFMLAFAPDYDHLTLMAKVEVFEHALENTPGNDLARVLWLKSRSSEVWLDRRTNYTRSLAVMSMVGYLLGLGDRHPSNLMLDRFSGKIIHIDFGDCFEASMNREKFPEKVPFRLTRMLVKAMEVSGIEGNFRFTCEAVLQVLRSNKDSVMAMMEAFVHDPLINWRLFNLTPTGGHAAAGLPRPPGGGGVDELAATGNLPSPPQRGARERELLQAVGQLGDANEVLNERAVAVMTRMSNKLTGRDFGTVPASGGSIGSLQASAYGGLERTTSGAVLGPVDARETEPGLSVKTQVQRLIGQATSHENLCQSYIGWCPFW